MAVEGLDGEPGSHVPDTCAFVSGSRNEKISERLKIKTIDRISVRSELLSHFKSV